MQVTKKTKYILFLSIFLLIFFSVSAQENTNSGYGSDTLVTQNDSTKTKHKFSFSSLFKHQKKETENTNTKNNDSGSSKKRFSVKNFFRHKNKSADTLTQQDSLINDSSNQKKRFKLFHKNKNDSLDISGQNGKPKSLTPGMWLKLNAEQQDSLLRAWDDYDKKHYVKKYTNSSLVKKIDRKRDKNIFDKLLLRTSGNKSYKYRKKLINRRISRYRTTMIYDSFKKSDTSPNDTISDKKKYQTVNKQFKREAKQEAIRKNKISLKYDRKEERLRRHFALTDNEQILLNKGKGMPLKGSEKIIFNKAQHKQEQFTEKLLKLRKKRSFALQNKDVQKRMSNKQKKLAKRDKIQYKKSHQKKFNTGINKKHDSSEYPKRWFRHN